MTFKGGSNGGRGSGPPLKNHENIGFLSNTGPDPLKKSQSYQASDECWAIIGPPVKRFLNGVPLAADDVPFITVFGSYNPNQLRKKIRYQIWTLSDKTFWIRAGHCCKKYCCFDKDTDNIIIIK